ncbi:glutathione S-transferase family protein [Planktotalea sp.]|uniref:glutathione S-transferase family protein n=1 Tax=Planktotalea sp. TaxID=2029877 RepID=UPI0025FBAC68|nr:glutathione S-transferase family protein [Planktotalea sp.]
MKLYGFDTINTLKVLMLLIETGADFEFIPVDIRAGEQHKPEFLAINPAGKVPVLCDGKQSQTESNAILLSIAQKTGWGLPKDPKEYSHLISWLFYQASTQGPHFGQIEYWSKFAETTNPEALAQHRSIANRTIRHLDDQLIAKQYICGKNYTIVDIALFPWLHVHDQLGLSIKDTDNLASWLERIRSRPASMEALAFFGSN